MNRVTAFAVLLVVLAAPAWAGWDESIAAYKRGDYATAFREMRPLAEQGLASPQFNLGLMYRKGQGVPQDDAEAARWYRKSAEQGHANAQYNLGVMYAKGQGVPEDYAEAVKWYRKAAEQGNASAQYNLGVTYYNGQGVPEDYVQAHMWFNLAAAGSPPGEDHDSADKNQDIVAKLMTPAQIAEAQRLAGMWRPSGQSGAAPDN